MTAYRVALVIFLAFLVLAEALKNPRIRNASNASNFNTSEFQDLYFAATLSNETSIHLNSTEPLLTRSKIPDCFGVGQAAAKYFESWFKINNDTLNSLDITFHLRSNKQKNRVLVMAGNQFGLEWTDFRAERTTIVIVHGFLSHSSEPWVKQMEDAFLAWGDVNIVAVDWAARGNTINYYKAVVNTKTVGREIARLLHHVVNATIAANAPREPKFGKLHLVGHSLGAHICGIAAKELKKLQHHWLVSRITGLDPAQPCFNNASAALQLDSSDAPFVDVIHTNGRVMSALGLGLPHPIGHVDFYPNGGKRQPGCFRLQSSYLDYITKYITLPKPLIEQAICSHGRSYLYLTESIIAATAGNCSFWGHSWDRTYRRALQIISEPCSPNNCTEMGIRAENHPQRGTFLALTSNASPFCAMSLEDKEQFRLQLRDDYRDEIQD